MDTVQLPTGSQTDRIPRLIHQTWKTSEVSDRLKPFQKTWLENHATWEYKLWTDEDNLNLIQTHYPWFLDYYNSYPHHIQRVDAARYFILYHYGGLYADLDMQCLTPIDPLTDQIGGVIVGQEGQIHHDGTQRIGNAIIFSSRHHPFWLRVFQSLLQCHAKSDPMKIGTVFTTTGPSFLHETYLKYPQGVTVMPASAFYPMPWHAPGETVELALRRTYPKSWTVHHWEGGWRSAPRQVSVQYHYGKQHLQMTFILPRKRDEGFGVIENHLVRGDVYRHRLLEKWVEVLQSGDNVIQVGAYNGYLTIPLAMIVTPGQVHAFEPDTRARQMLAEAVRLNNLKNVLIYDCMPTSHTVRMFRINKFNPIKPHRTIWRAQQPNAIDICMGTPLDAVLIENVALIHIDVNGEEYQVLQGAEQIIARDRPIMTIDIWPSEKRTEFSSPIRDDQVFALLDRLKYNYQVVESSTYLCTPEEIYET
jgi:FkbM family methyltransferase